VINQFTSLGRDPRVSFFGGVTLGKHVSLQDLRTLYHGVVLAYGAESDRRLGIPGEGAKNVFSAREFVWWYNGHPDAAGLPVDLRRVESVAVCGIGNVALDCARVLLQDPKALSVTDVASHALAALAAPLARDAHAPKAGPPLRSVCLVARRGPVQAACTPRELKELVGEMPGLAVHAPDEQMVVSEADAAEMAASRTKRRVHDIIKQAAKKHPATPTPSRHLHFEFYRQPRQVLVGDDGYVSGLVVERTELRAEPGKPAVAVGTGVLETIPCQLVLVSIGYRSLPVDGAPFDKQRGTIPNRAGRVLAQGTASPSAADPGLYVCGWLKRGPTGIIGTNAIDADETVASICADVSAGALQGGEKAGGQGLRSLLHIKGVQHADWPGWLKVDAAEVKAGQARGKVREKVVAIADMLKIAAS